MQFHTVAASWEQNPAQMQQVLAQQHVGTLLNWADRAAGNKMWSLASVLYTAVSLKVAAVNTYCVRQAAKSFKPEAK